MHWHSCWMTTHQTRIELVVRAVLSEVGSLVGCNVRRGLKPRGGQGSREQTTGKPVVRVMT